MIRMVNQKATAEEHSVGAEHPKDIKRKLALERTNLAHERTMMAWIRTATALISFGFSIYKFFELEKGAAPAIQRQIIGPHLFAILMIGVGILALLIASLEHLQHIKSLKIYHVPIQRSLAGLIAGFVGILGILALVAVIFRL
jgi:putative membrane protein